jgi:hypothetical protein
MYVCVAESFTSRARVASYRVPEPVPGVRIPPFPPHSLKCRETGFCSPEITEKRRNSAIIAFEVDQRKWRS